MPQHLPIPTPPLAQCEAAHCCHERLNGVFPYCTVCADVLPRITVRELWSIIRKGRAAKTDADSVYWLGQFGDVIKTTRVFIGRRHAAARGN